MKTFLSILLLSSVTALGGTVFNYPPETAVQPSDVLNLSALDATGTNQAYKTIVASNLISSLASTFGMAVTNTNVIYLTDANFPAPTYGGVTFYGSQFNGAYTYFGNLTNMDASLSQAWVCNELWTNANGPLTVPVYLVLGAKVVDLPGPGSSVYGADFILVTNEAYYFNIDALAVQLGSGGVGTTNAWQVYVATPANPIPSFNVAIRSSYGVTVTRPATAGAVITNSVASIPGESAVGSYTVLNVEVSDTTDTAIMTRDGFYMGPVPMQNLRIWLDDWTYLPGPPSFWETNNTVLTNTASIEYPAGTFYQCTWAGNTSLILRPGQLPTPCDPLPVTIPANAQYWVRIFRTIPTGGALPLGLITDNNSLHGGFLKGAVGTVTDKTLSGTISDNFGYSFGPDLITGVRADGGKVAPVSVYLNGDSIMYGPNGNIGFNYQVSYATAAFTNYCNLVQGSATAQTVEGYLGASNILSMLPYCGQVVINQLGVNDWRSSVNGGENQSFASITNWMQQEWNYQALLGMRVYQETLTPETTSSDDWITIANQTPDANSATMTNLNNWIRTCPFPLSGVIDKAAEVTTNLIYWKVLQNGITNSLTLDGVHPAGSYGSNYVITNGYANAVKLILQAQNGNQNVGNYALGTTAASGPQVNGLTSVGQLAAHDFGGNTNLPAPTITAGPGACYAVFTNHPASDACQDIMVVGTNTTGGTLFTVTFGTPFGNGIVPSIIGPLPQNLNAQLLDNNTEFIWATNKTSANYVVSNRSAVGLTAGAVYVFSVMVMH